MRSFFLKAFTELKSSGVSSLFFRKSLRYSLRLGSRVIGLLIPLNYMLRRLKARPLTLNLATTNICNARCVFCGYSHLSVPQGVMSEEVFRKTVHEYVSMGGGNIDLTPNTGEPLLDPELIKRIRYCREFSRIRRIIFVTNGILLRKSNLLELLTSGVSEIIISMGGLDKYEYRELFGVDQFEKVLESVISLCSLNRELGSRVRISVALRTAKRIKDLELLPAFRKLSGCVELNYQYNYHTWGGLVTKNDLRGLMRFINSKSLKEPCCKYYGGLTVLWNGDVTVCGCTDINGTSQLVLGNVLKNSLKELWEGAMLERIRAGFTKACCQDRVKVVWRSPAQPSLNRSIICGKHIDNGGERLPRIYHEQSDGQG